ncbi:Uncharacterised protein [Chlamydia trachomatis]|nr:Uncharacterised protein [Chlamydia trachomatis]
MVDERAGARRLQIVRCAARAGKREFSDERGRYMVSDGSLRCGKDHASADYARA